MNGSNEHIGPETDSRGFQQLSLSHSPDFAEVLMCVLDVPESEARTYLALSQHQSADVYTLAEELDRSSNRVREHLSLLEEKELTARDTRITKQGKHYTYQVLPTTNMRSTLHALIKDWNGYVSDRINSLGEHPIDEPFKYRAVSATASMAITPSEDYGDTLSVRNIMTGMFGLELPLMKLYLALLGHPGSTAPELAEIQNFARSTVSGRLNDLQDRGLACPAPREIDGTMAYEYVPRPLDEVQNAMHDQLEEWIEHAHQSVEEFDFFTIE
jgi:predicted transcriptional regulator